MIYGAYSNELISLDEIIMKLGDIYDEYNWLLSDIEVYISNKNVFSSEYEWLSGKELKDLFSKRAKCMIWCVVSGFNKSVSPDQVIENSLPYADGNKGFWVDEVNLQTPFTEIEIVFFDGNACFILSKNQKHRDDFLLAFPNSYDLISNNRRINSIISVIHNINIKVFCNYTQEQLEQNDWYVYHGIFNDKKLNDDLEAIRNKAIMELKEKGLL